LTAIGTDRRSKVTEFACTHDTVPVDIVAAHSIGTTTAVVHQTVFSEYTAGNAISHISIRTASAVISSDCVEARHQGIAATSAIIDQTFIDIRADYAVAIVASWTRSTSETEISSIKCRQNYPIPTSRSQQENPSFSNQSINQSINRQ
jgi:hypothetical protein